MLCNKVTHSRECQGLARRRKALFSVLGFCGAGQQTFSCFANASQVLCSPQLWLWWS